MKLKCFFFSDIPNVCHVINYDMPKNIDEYVHRIGRTGRLGNEGRSTSFYDPEQVKFCKKMSKKSFNFNFFQ